MEIIILFILFNSTFFSKHRPLKYEQYKNIIICTIKLLINVLNSIILINKCVLLDFKY